MSQTLHPTNPFYFGGKITNPACFVGRRAELRFITQRMAGLQMTSVAVVGERRIGKSSLHYHFDKMWSSASPAEQEALRQIAAGGAPSAPAAVLAALGRRELIEPGDHGYRFQVPLVRRWVQKLLFTSIDVKWGWWTVGSVGGNAMITRQILGEVVTLPEASAIARQMGYALDRSNLLRYARSGRLVARKSQGTWLTTRSAVQALILELTSEARGRPRAQVPTWADVETTPELAAKLAQIDQLRARLSQHERSATEEQQWRRELIVEAIYHTNHIEGNQLSLPEVRAIVEDLWAEQESQTDTEDPTLRG